jgi:uncharacterized protein (TIGR03437 family)
MLLALPLAANPVNPPLSFTGGFGEPNCGQCHTGTTATSGSNVMILGTPAIYSPGSTIPIQVQITDSAANWGFELSARFTNGSQAGRFTPNNTVSVQTGTWKGFKNIQYAAQGAAAVQSGSSYTFSVNWTAPPDSTGGEIVFDAASVSAPSDPGTAVGQAYVAEARSAAGAPMINAAGVVSAASFQNSLAAGELISIFGANLTTGGPYAATGFPLPARLGATDVRINGVQCPLLYVSATQINAQVPFGYAGPFSLFVAANSLISPTEQVSFSDTAPAIFSSAGAGAILHANYSAVSAANPATPGEIVLIYATGLGQTMPPSTAGLAAVSATVPAVSVTIGGATAFVNYAGVAPGYAGLYQVNTTVPVTNPPLSGNLQVALTVGAVTSPSGITITVQ